MAITNGFQVSPGVNIKETDLSQVIAAVATTDGAHAGVYSWGPMKKRVQITSEEALVAMFGRPSNFNAETWFTDSLFLADSDSLFISRAGNTSGESPSLSVNVTANSAIVKTSNTAGLKPGMILVGSDQGSIVNAATIASVINTTAFSLASASQAVRFSNNDFVQFISNTAVFSAIANTGPVANLSSNMILNNEDFETKDGLFDNDIRMIARYPGSRGNSLRVSRCDTATAFTSTINLASYSASISINVNSNTATVIVANTTPSANIAETIEFVNNQAIDLRSNFQVTDQVEFGNPTAGFQSLNITSFGASTVTSNSTYVENQFTITFEDELKLIASQVANGDITRYWEFYDLVDQAPGQSDYVRSFGNSAVMDELHLVVVDDGGLFTGTPGAVLETYKAVSRANDAKTIDGSANWYKSVINQQSQYVWIVNDRPTAVSNTALNLTNPTTNQVMNLSFGLGSDGADEYNVAIGDLANAYDLFASAEDVDISLILTGLNRGGPSSAQLANYLIDNIAEIRKDVVVFISPTKNAVVNNRGFEAEYCVNFRNALRSTSYGFLDSNYMYIYDRYNNLYRWVPCNGAIAGLAVRTDRTNDPWWSFAGFNRGALKNVIKLAWNPRKAERDQLYKNNVNPVNTFPGDGTVLYGDKTLQAKASAFDRINVRRLFIVLEKAISNYAKYSLFEFNDEITRALFKSRIIPYLRDIKSRRGITDFNVVCDTTNNTPQVIDTNQFMGAIEVKPNRSINFITLNFVAVGTGVTFSETLSSI